MLMKLIHGDCLEELPKLEDKSVDLVVVDLPYGQTECKWDTKIDLTTMWKELKRVGKDNIAYIFFTTTKYGNDLINSNPKWFKYDLVWRKSNIVGFLNANRMPLREHEMLYIFYNKLPIYNPQKKNLERITIKKHVKDNGATLYGKGKDMISEYNGTYPKSILEFSNPANKRFHSTEKPVDLLEWLIKTYSNENDEVLDFTMGSASTGIACINTNRKFIGIEKNKDIYDIAVKRINEYDV